jgi:CheY-like chemotaxis protein
MPAILYIDDVPQALVLRKCLLEEKGYQVLTATDGLEGIETAREQPIDAVLLDYDLPGMRGDEVAVLLKREHPTLPIIVLTGHAWDIPEMLLRISDWVVEKGEGAAVLLTAIEGVLKRPPKAATANKEEKKAG